MKKHNIWIADLTHTATGISAATFPLGVSYVFSYAKKELGKEFNFRLFKFPSHLAEALGKETPALLCFSNYSWNFELAYKFAFLAKQHNKNVIIVFGGPNFPSDQYEKLEYLKKRSAIDFYTEQEGEIGFVDLVQSLASYNFNINELKKDGKKILNTTYMYNDQLVTGQIERIKDINVIPSPYLTGALDEFFNLPLIPMLETTRGCPFACTFCTDGLAIKNRVSRYQAERTKEELRYIAKKVRTTDELIITDLNFAMYKQDLATANSIADIQQKYNYPTIVSAAAGKNLPKRTIEVATKIKGWVLGGSVQSTDPEVLKSIKRSNISSEAYREMINISNNQKDKKTQCEIILGLPGDTKQRHYESLRFGLDNNVNSLRMHQAMLLIGTEMASKTARKEFGFVTKFRTIPGCVGRYDIYDKQHSVAEIEEIIVGSKTFPVEDYLDCRVMNLMIKTFYNNSMFEEVYAMLRAMNVSPFDCLKYIKEHSELYSDRIKKILVSFVKETTSDLYDTWEQANQSILSSKILNSYLGGELGNNELLMHRALMFNEFQDICYLMFESVTQTLKQKDLLTNAVKDYLIELKKFTSMRKNNVLLDTKKITNSEFWYDFESIRNDFEYSINPNNINKLEKPRILNFFQEKDQREHVSTQLKFYSSHAIGLGRLLQRSNMKLIFRRFAEAKELHATQTKPNLET